MQIVMIMMRITTRKMAQPPAIPTMVVRLKGVVVVPVLVPVSVWGWGWG